MPGCGTSPARTALNVQMSARHTPLGLALCVVPLELGHKGGALHESNKLQPVRAANAQNQGRSHCGRPAECLQVP